MILDINKISLKRNGVWILKEITWKVNRGEHWVLFGLNGAGKTALLNVLNAYEYPTQGKITVLGKEFGKSPLAENLRKKDLFPTVYSKSSIQGITHLKLS